MAFYFAYITAADFWRLAYNPNRVLGAPEVHVPFAPEAHSARDLASVAPNWVADIRTASNGGPVHLLVPDVSSRSRGVHIESHVWGSPLPEGSFYRYSKDIYVASPAFTFLHLARTCSLPQLVAYGNELCGRYAFDYRDERGFHTRGAPLCSLDDLRGFLDAAAGAIGARRARKALDFVMEGAESPMETLTVELMALPYRYGGYGIPDLRLNEEIPLESLAKAIGDRGKCRADILCKAARIDVEFQGKYDHSREEAFDSDRRRTNALTSMDYKVIELTNDQVRNMRAFEAIALMIAKRMGKRIDNKYKGPIPARISLRNDLFAWNAAGGRPGK